MKRISAKLLLLLFVSLQFSGQALAQSRPPASGPLADFVNNADNGSSDLQRMAGNAIQAACSGLNSYAQSIGLPNGFLLPAEQGDLFARCNEMVQTAAELQGNTSTTRSLGLSGSELNGVMQQVSGEEQLSQSTLSTRVTNGQFSNIAGRLNAVRLGGASAASGGRVAATGTYDDPDRRSPAYQQVSLSGGGAAGDADIAGSRLGWFIEGSYNTGDRDETVSEDGFDFDATSFTLGLDYLLNSGVIGFSIGVDDYSADFQTSTNVAGGDVEVEGTSGSLFGAWYKNAWYFDGIVSFGNLDSDASRVAFYVSNNPACIPACPGENRTLTGETKGDYVSAGATVGYDLTRGNWDISPTLSIAYRDINMDGYTEVDTTGGGLNLSYDKQEIKSLKTILGVSFVGNYSRSFGILSPQVRFEWHHETEDDPSRLTAKYAVEEQLAALGVTGAAGAGDFTLSSCISCFVINGDLVDNDFGLVGLGLSAVFSQRIQIYGIYDALIGMDHLTSNAFSVGIRGQF
jgi:outer membrane autotransporter protein